ncbi:MAG: polysaccharide biosynthesis tyrosine autokinase [Bryobacterales bacterium]|nr:polysaccharide biosynthesis tyrosine autokinase [Bryobacterales bacterium]
MKHDRPSGRELSPGRELMLSPRNVPAHALRPPQQPMDEALDRVPITQYLYAIYRNRWRIVPFTMLSIVATLLVSLRMTPLYEAITVLDVDRNGEVEAVGSESRSASPVNTEQFMSTQIHLIESDAVLRPVALQFELPLERKEAWFAPQRENDAAARLDAPAELKNLKVTHPPQTFLIYIRYRSENPRLAADVANAIAQSYIDHVFRIRHESSRTLSQFMERQLDELRSKMEASNAALVAFERELNMIDPEERTSIISSRLLQLNTEFTAAQADRVRREAAFRALGNGSLDAATVSSQGEQVRKIEERRNEALESFAKVKQHYGPNHPSYAVAKAELDQIEKLLIASTATVQRQIGLEFNEGRQRETILGNELRQTKAEFDRLNANSFQYKTLKREADADRKLYEELVSKTKQATINSGFPSSAIRIADRARPAYAPVSPNTQMNVLLAGLFSLMLAVGVAILSDTLDLSVRDPALVSLAVGAEVLGALPRVRNPARLIPAMVEESAQPEKALIRARDSANRSIAGYQESIKTLSTSLMLADFDQRVKTMMVTSASPSEGKSTVATAIAIAHAAKGDRVLLIDADLRRPSIGDKLGITRSTGLSDVCLKNMPWHEAVHPLVGVPGLSVITAGQSNRRAIDHFGRVFADLLAETPDEYDFVIVDTPPLLGFSEPLHLATLVDGVLLVAMAGSTNRRALQTCANQLRRVGASILGIVMNAATKENQAGGAYHHYYATDYTKYHSDSSRNRESGMRLNDESLQALAATGTDGRSGGPEKAAPYPAEEVRSGR